MGTPHHFGPRGITELELHGGVARISDDTQMTLFTLEGLLRALKRNPAAQDTEIISEIAAAYQDWLATQESRRDWRLAGALFVVNRCTRCGRPATPADRRCALLNLLRRRRR